MTRTLTARTFEIDDVDVAVSEVLAQLDMPLSLLDSSIGILTCYSEYIDTGVVKALCEKLPFDVVGSTTLGCATNEEFGETMLSLMVITSDDIKFTAELTDKISVADELVLQKSYQSALAKCSEAPKFILSFAPLLMNVGADFFINAMDKITGDLPNYGTLAVDHNNDYHDAQVIFNGEAARDKYAFVLVSGDISPVFLVASISSENVFQEKCVVTASNGNQLQTVNDISVSDFLQSLGLRKNAEGAITGINSFPFIVDYNDGTKPVVRVMFAVAPDGSAVCGGDMPVGTTLQVGRIDADEVLATTTKLLENVLERKKINALLMFSCVGRYFAQGFDQTAEMCIVQKMLKDTNIPYQFTYSGSELCPVYDESGKPVNRNHNDTFTICMF